MYRNSKGTGREAGLSLVLNADISEYYCSSTNSYGFKALVHNPIEQPKIAHYGSTLANGFETSMVVTPIVAESARSIRNVPKHIRQCIFEDENILIFYR